MTRDKGQVLMFTEQELGLIKATFADKEDAIYLVRKALLQFPLTEVERKQLKGFMTEEVFNVVKKRVFSEINENQPLTQLSDFYQSLNSDLKTKGVEDMSPLFAAKKIELEYLGQQFAFLKDVDGLMPTKIVLDNLKHITDDYRQTFINTTARNFLLSYVDSFLNLLKNLAGAKEETVEEQEKRLTRDSSK